MKVEKLSVSGSNGVMLDCAYWAAERRRPWLLIALPFGVPMTVCGAAFEQFAGAFNVATWETRYVRSLQQEFLGDENLAPSEHVADMLCILAKFKIDTCYLIGYCSGAGISLQAACMYPEIFRGLALVSGEYQLFRRGVTPTKYQNSIDQFLPAAAASRGDAEMMLKQMGTKEKSRSTLEAQINEPFRDPERLFRYARSYLAYRDFNARQTASRVTQSTLVVAGTLDEHSGVEGSQTVAASIRRSMFYLDEAGDHYEFCRAGSRILGALSAHLSREA